MSTYKSYWNRYPFTIKYLVNILMYPHSFIYALVGLIRSKRKETFILDYKDKLSDYQAGIELRKNKV